MSRVCILMNCRNGELFVEKALKSVAEQTYKNWVVIFVDNRSTDKSVEIARSFGNQIQIVETPHDMSLCEARVFSRPYIRGEYFCVLDIDDLWFPTKLEKQIDVMVSNPDVGIVYSNTMYFDDHGDIEPAYAKTQPSGHLFRNLLSNYFFSLETVMVRTSIMNTHNIYFEPGYNVSSDVEFFVRLAYHTKAKYIDEILAKWRVATHSQSIKHFESFPREYEKLLEKLRIEIPQFDQNFSSEIKHLNGIIQNMYGLADWQKGDHNAARAHFLRAAHTNPRYFIPWIATKFVSYNSYNRWKLKSQGISR
jgi:glycosyltransferase involved in cell wall biosynthesis